MWNNRKLGGTPFLRKRTKKLLITYGTDYLKNPPTNKHR